MVIGNIQEHGGCIAVGTSIATSQRCSRLRTCICLLSIEIFDVTVISTYDVLVVPNTTMYDVICKLFKDIGGVQQQVQEVARVRSTRNVINVVMVKLPSIPDR
ncbi:hypothetical protein AHAS_Ahas09G0122000 [Arachis hypogaea]